MSTRRVRVSNVFLSAAFLGFFAALAWIGLPHWETIFSENGVAVRYVENQESLYLRVNAPATIWVSFVFDYRQDGRVKTRQGVDPSYGLCETGALCTQNMINDYAATICGGMPSSSRIIDLKRAGSNWQYTLMLPKRELSASGKSANMVLNIWDNAKQEDRSYPSTRFMHPIVLVYRHPTN
jgi:hypothetical protein